MFKTVDNINDYSVKNNAKKFLMDKFSFLLNEYTWFNEFCHENRHLK